LIIKADLFTVNNSSIKPHLLIQPLLGADYKKLIYTCDILKIANVY